MTLSEGDRRFLERRRERTHVGLFVLPLVLLGFVALWGVLFVYWPLAINPFYAAVHYEGQRTLTTYAIIVTILLNVLLLAISLAVCFAVLWARSERRYLRLLARLVKVEEGAKKDAAAKAEAAAAAGKVEAAPKK